MNNLELIHQIMLKLPPEQNKNYVEAYKHYTQEGRNEYRQEVIDILEDFLKELV